MIKNFLIYYLIVYFSVFTHEIMHMFSAYLFKIKSNKCYVGEKLFRIKIFNLYISPIAFGGYNEVYIEELLTKSKTTITLYFLSGILGNLIVIFISLVLFESYFIFTIIANTLMIVVSLLPKGLKRNDMKELTLILRQKK